MSTPVHIEAPGSAAHHGGGPNHPNALLYNNPHHIPHSMTAAVLARNAAVSAGNGAVVSAAPDVIRVPSPPHGNQLNPGNPEYAEIPGEMSAQCLSEWLAIRFDCIIECNCVHLSMVDVKTWKLILFKEAYMN